MELHIPIFLTISVIFYQVKMFYDDQITNSTFVGKKNGDVQYALIALCNSTIISDNEYHIYVVGTYEAYPTRLHLHLGSLSLFPRESGG